MRLSEPASRDESSPIGLAEARRMFHRVLSSWAMDVLYLRKHGLDRPGVREGRGHPLCGVPDEAVRPSRRRAA